ncbi:ATP-binding protein involved in chromosome partitioning [Methylohalomonas lacus]|uniref:Iron-sulfur cluster carrier protein n=1 Tax=Methylohalomonas lacus TaxID=398773 RepID=A0AAE3L2C6_9GAMM|nr:iron-sulfur cluster carrier protein ApbC [Methylohalomonas lacus]MCS3904286.1 ATP-binding protein involved in chromosome partitioning [Methylohalomonas lacus]
MSELTKERIQEALATCQIESLQTDPVSAGAVGDIQVEDARVRVSLTFGFPFAGAREAIEQSVRECLAGIAGERAIELDLQQKVVSHATQKGLKPLANVKNIIAVASGKGGVGKSTVAVNLALALQAEGASVGVLDADIYGPSQPRMLGCQGKPETTDGKTVEPKVSYGIQSMSIGYLIDEETPMIWRGPMVTSALEQLLNDTNWRDLDYLVIDLPPGTGDIQLTLCQKIPVSGAIIVTTPQDIALLDARKALKMFEKVEVPVLGVVENMSIHICSECGHEEHVFGEGGGESMAKQYDTEMLGALPLAMDIREGVDNGKPTVALQPKSRTTEIFRNIARRSAAKLALRARDYSSKFPNIVVENT